MIKLFWKIRIWLAWQRLFRAEKQYADWYEKQFGCEYDCWIRRSK